MRWWGTIWRSKGQRSQASFISKMLDGLQWLRGATAFRSLHLLDYFYQCMPVMYLGLTLCYPNQMIPFSCTLSREYRVVRYRYSRLLFTSEDRLCANLRVQEQYDITMPVPRVRVTSQINCDDVTMLSQKRPSLATMAKWAIDDCL